MKHTQSSISGFSIIEVLIGIFIFTLGLVAVYAVIQSTIRMSDYNRHYSVATNLGKEQIELMRHIRDSNYDQLKPYMQMDPLGSVADPDSFFGNGFYKIYHDFTVTSNNTFPTGVENIDDITDIESYRICSDEKGRYVYCDPIDSSHTLTPLYRYIEISDVPGISEAKKIRSVVEWRSKGEHRFEVSTILTDWRRL